jgi:hypothetical protein
MNKGFEWQVRKFLEDQDDLKHFTYTDTAVPCAAKTASNVRRADFTYVLMDRVVFLEVDENEHRYNSPECERKREQQLADSVPGGKYVVLVRYNPLAKRRTFMQNLETLAEKLREGFVSDDVKLATDGIHRIFVGYQMATIRRLDAAYAEVQNIGLKRTRDHASSEQASDSKTQIEVEINPEDLEFFESNFYYLKKTKKYFDHKTGEQYDAEQFLGRTMLMRTVVRRFDETRQKTVMDTYESGDLWLKRREKNIETYDDLTYVRGGDRVISKKLNVWKRPKVKADPSGDCSEFYELLRHLMPDELTREWFLDVLAYKHRYPEKGPGVCIQLLGGSPTFVDLLCNTVLMGLFGETNWVDTERKLGPCAVLACGEALFHSYAKSVKTSKRNIEWWLDHGEVVWVKRLTEEERRKKKYELAKKTIAEGKLLWIMETKDQRAVRIEDPDDRRHVIIRCNSSYSTWCPSWNFEDQEASKLVADIESRALRAKDRPDGKDFVPDDFDACLPEILKRERERAMDGGLNAIGHGLVDQSNDPFFESLKKDVHEKAFTETFLKSKGSVNGMHPFDWNKLNESNCFYHIGKTLYQEYKTQRGDGVSMSTSMFAQKLKEIGFVKAQKKMKGSKQADVMWVGFKRKRNDM